jgi:hypothetical protein
MSETQYVVRTQSNFAGMYGLGEVISPGVVLFRYGNYDMSLEELNKKLKAPKKAK